MAKRKINRTLVGVGESQHVSERAAEDKFRDTHDIAHAAQKIGVPAPVGRVSPQISCTVAPDDKKALTDITLFLSAKYGRVLNTSSVIRALIKLGDANRDSLEVP